MWSEAYSDAEYIKEIVEDSLSDKISEVKIDFMDVEIVDDKLESLELQIPVSSLDSEVIDEIESEIDELMYFHDCNYTKIDTGREWTMWKFVFEESE